MSDAHADPAVLPRRVTIDIGDKSARRKKRRKRRRKPKDAQPEQEPVTYPLEMRPVMEAVLEYGRRTNAIGSLEGAAALDELVKRIRTLTTSFPVLEELADDAERRSSELKAKFRRAYDG
jgi:hypothetical protein